MSDLSKQLRATVQVDGVNGDSFERVFCGWLMGEAADRLDEQDAEITRLTEENTELRRQLETAKAEAVAEEREACAKEADRFAEKNAVALRISEHIRARFKEVDHDVS